MSRPVTGPSSTSGTVAASISMPVASAESPNARWAYMVAAIITPLPTIVIRNAAPVAPMSDRVRTDLLFSVPIRGALSSTNSAANAAPQTGMLIAKIPRQPTHAINEPPMTGPSAVAEADTEDHTPSAFARAAGSRHKEVSAARLAGNIAAAPSPCNPREANRTDQVGARAHPSDPASYDPNISVYAEISAAETGGVSTKSTSKSARTPPLGTAAKTNGHPDIAHTASVLADRPRAAMLFALTGDRALPATMLAAEAGVSTSTASGHLNRLIDADFVTVEQHGRNRYFRLADPGVATAIESLAAIAPRERVNGLRGYNRLQRLRSARTCYDHLAGRVGTRAMSWLTEQSAIERTDGDTGTGRGPTDRLSARVKDAPYRLGPRAHDVFGDWEIDVAELGRGRRPLIRVCVDWTEQSHHLAGGLGAAMLRTFTYRGWVRPSDRPREVKITDSGRRNLPEVLDIAEQ